MLLSITLHNSFKTTSISEHIDCSCVENSIEYVVKLSSDTSTYFVVSKNFSYTAS
ncbi:hypothetical protein [Paraclostridium sordellii]|uniref:hypothetical protein n=1 Tax=Paraclostridium sordellii TaxID=1505 RepID=UPI0012D76B2C|nr:hypothetical protein [Paeniclostridium sordellii]